MFIKVWIRNIKNLQQNKVLPIGKLVDGLQKMINFEKKYFILFYYIFLGYYYVENKKGFNWEKELSSL